LAQREEIEAIATDIWDPHLASVHCLMISWYSTSTASSKLSFTIKGKSRIRTDAFGPENNLKSLFILSLADYTFYSVT
jgi:hypothetical protein